MTTWEHPSGECSYTDESKVTLTDHLCSDLMVVQAARVSTLGADAVGTSESAGLIDYLLRSFHGSPFESGYLRFLVETPIVVAREFMRHRVGMSYSEVSGRYVELTPKFYVPPLTRPLVQKGKPGEYTFVEGTDTQKGIVQGLLTVSSHKAAQTYARLLEAGVAREVARMCLPVNLMTAFYVSMNPRSLMHFLSLRVREPDATFPSFPMWEIDQVARQMEEQWSRLMPHTHSAFVKHGRVSP